MPQYRSVGDVSRKRHTKHRQPDGRLYYEELMGSRGFSGESSLLYHRESPSAIVAAEAVGEQQVAVGPDHPVVPRHLRTSSLPVGGDPVLDRHVLLGNGDVRMSWVAADRSSGLYRNACGDELVYVQHGRAILQTSFGELVVGANDYVVIPTGTTQRWLIDDGESLGAVVFEAAGHVQPPARYVSERGQFLEHAPYCERDIRMPLEPLVVDDGDVPILVRTTQGLSRLVHANHPFDVAGWDGCLYPWAFNIADFEPIVGRVHQPPPVHQTFAGPNFVICSFVPRLFDFHPDAVKVPYHHANVDSDEVLFYSAGNFMSRTGSGIGVGSISFHPAGFVHGPQPGSIERSEGVDRTEEVAVMLDTFHPLGVSQAGRTISDPDYPWTWAGGRRG
jgi:homogentisate 1,2-dioxygenase